MSSSGTINIQTALMAETFPSREIFHAWLKHLWAAELAREKRDGQRSFPLAHHSEKGSHLEAWSRLLWGILPAIRGAQQEGGELPDGMEEILHTTLERLRAGVDPEHPEYFGECSPYDQRFVEMAVLGLAMEWFPERFRGAMKAGERDRLRAWFGQIYAQPLPENNWRFFRCFVSLGLLRLTADDADRLAETRAEWNRFLQDDLEFLENCYIGGGWYGDGPGGKRDYYNPFGFHTYALILYGLRPDRLVLQRFRDRVLTFLPAYAALFDHSGAAIPFGRSMTYRFAQGSLLSACLCLGIYHEEDDRVPSWCTLGWLKTMLHRHLRYWFAQPMFTSDGRLSVGYAYPNIAMSEEYNAYGSPGWGLKTLLFLSLPATHPFWSAKVDESVDGLPDAVRREPHLPGLLVRAEEGSHAFLLNGGQLTPANANKWMPRHAEAKYAKFVYSSRFGFSVPTSLYGSNQCGPDSTLAVSLDGEVWLTRRIVEEVAVTGKEVQATWRPFGNDRLVIKTRLIPLDTGHLRVHEIQSEVAVRLQDGGFACPCDPDPHHTGDRVIESQNQLTLQRGDLSSSLLQGVLEGRAGDAERVILCIQNGAHLLFPLARVPALRVGIEPGQSRFATAFHGGFPSALPAFQAAVEEYGHGEGQRR